MPCMSTIIAILEAHADGTLHLPVPAELRHGKVEVTATLKAHDGSIGLKQATPDMLLRRKEALSALRGLGGLREAISDPASWQREQRRDRPLPGRE